MLDASTKTSHKFRDDSFYERQVLTTYEIRRARCSWPRREKNEVNSAENRTPFAILHSTRLMQSLIEILIENARRERERETSQLTAGGMNHTGCLEKSLCD